MKLLGFYSKKEVNQTKLKSYENGYKAGKETSSLINRELSNRIKILEEENKKLKQNEEEENYKAIRQIEAIANRTKRPRVKKKCEARLLKLRLKGRK